MANIRIPCLVSRSNAAGIASWYWQPSKTLAAAGWRPLALGKNREEAMRAADARNTEVERWRAGGATGPQSLKEVRKRHAAGTFGALAARYRRELIDGVKPDGSPLIRENTRATYSTSLARLEAWAGDRQLAWITAARVRALRDASARPEGKGGIGHSAAFNLLRQLRQVLAFAEAIDVLPKGSNPAAAFGLGKPPARKTVWTAADDTAFDLAAIELGLPSMQLAREVALYTAQRQADLVRFSEGQLAELDILEPVLCDRLADASGKVFGWSLSQGKTSTDHIDVRLEIPFEPIVLERVREALAANRARDRAASPPRLPSFVLVDDRTGLPWKQREFRRTFREVCDFAAKRFDRPNMAELTWHDLRRTRVVRLRRRGMAKEMIAALTGHSLAAIEEMLRVYGPVDPTITASAVVASLDPRATPAPLEATAEA